MLICSMPECQTTAGCKCGHGVTWLGPSVEDLRQKAEGIDARSCTCYPGEGPLPCPGKHALRDCWRAAVLDETQQTIVALKNRDRQPHEQNLLAYLMRVRTALELETSDWPEVTREYVAKIDSLLAPEFATGNWQMVESDETGRVGRPPAEAISAPDTITEVCVNPNCPRGGTPVEVILPRSRR